MSFLLRPWHILLVTICGVLNQRPQQIIEFQNIRIAALLKKPGRKRLLLDDKPATTAGCERTGQRPQGSADCQRGFQSAEFFAPVAVAKNHTTVSSVEKDESSNDQLDQRIATNEYSLRQTRHNHRRLEQPCTRSNLLQNSLQHCRIHRYKSS